MLKSDHFIKLINGTVVHSMLDIDIKIGVNPLQT